jgi:hypothetical protein
MTLTKSIRATAGAAVSDLCPNRLALVRYLNRLQKDIKTGIFGLDELPHLPAMGSVSINFRGDGDDEVVLAIGPTTITKARLIPGSLRAEKSAL